MTVTITQKELLRHGLQISRQLDKYRDKSISIKARIVHLINTTSCIIQPADEREIIINNLNNIQKQIGYIQSQITEYNSMVTKYTTKDDPYHLYPTSFLLNHKFKLLIKRHNANLALADDKLLIKIN